MSSYNFNSIVSNSEQEALKDMIFKRARERAQALSDDVQNSYTSAVQNDVMDLARDSFSSARNPFVEKEEIKNSAVEQEDNRSQEIGFAKRHVNEIKSQMRNRTQSVNTEMATKTLDATMLEASEAFRNKQSFMGALNFLNSQAYIALVQNRGKKFEALA